MRASRMMSLLLHLQVRGQVSGKELAERLEVSERTVQRDVEALAAAGVPARARRGGLARSPDPDRVRPRRPYRDA